MQEPMFKSITKKAKQSQIPVSLRTPEDELSYFEAKLTGSTKPFLEEERLKEWQFWALIENRFPYSAAFKTHHLLIPKRVVEKNDLNKQEQRELEQILDELDQDYDCYLVNYKSKQSVLYHFHVHLMTYKDQRDELRI